MSEEKKDHNHGHSHEHSHDSHEHVHDHGDGKVHEHVASHDIHSHGDFLEKLEGQKTHEQMHKDNTAHIHIHNHGQVKVRIATEEEIQKGIKFIDEDVKKEEVNFVPNHCNNDGHSHSHAHDHSHGHGHHHDPAETKKILNRFSRAIGHMEKVKRMVESDVDCSEVLIQLSAVKSAVNNIGREILKEHVTHCIIDAEDGNHDDAVDMLSKALDQFMK